MPAPRAVLKFVITLNDRGWVVDATTKPDWR
jgi:hypothetical protein